MITRKKNPAIGGVQILEWGEFERRGSMPLQFMILQPPGLSPFGSASVTNC